MGPSSPTFDIFSGTPEKEAVWVCAVPGLAGAKERMEQIAAAKPGAYFVYYSAANEVMAKVDTTGKERKDASNA